MTKSISDFDKYAASLNEIINPEIRAELEEIYKDNSATFQFFKEVDKSVQDVLRDSTGGAIALQQIKTVLPILKSLENNITIFASKKRSKTLDKEIIQLISDIKNEMSIGEVEEKNRQFFDLLEKNKQALKNEWQPPKRFTDQFFYDEIAKLNSSISSYENQITSLSYEIQSAINEENRIKNEQQQAMQRYHAMGRIGFADSWENKQFNDMLSSVYSRRYSAQSSIEKLRGSKTECETKKREFEKQLSSKEDERLKRHYQDLFNKKNTASTEEEFIKLAEEFREFEGYFEDAEELAKECEDMPRKIQYNSLIRAKILAKTEQEFREIAKESRSLSMKFKDTEFLELAKECTNRADEIAEQERQKQEQIAEQERIRLAQETKNKYVKLVQAKNNASTEDEFQNLAKQFRDMNIYENTAELAKECDEKHRVLKEHREEQEKKERENQYNSLVEAYKKASTEKEFEYLAKQFRNMNGYKDYRDTAELARECDRMLKNIQEEQKRLKTYNKLIQTKTEISTKEEFQYLAKQFREMNGYKDTIELAKECEATYARKIRNKKIRKAITWLILLVIMFPLMWFLKWMANNKISIVQSSTQQKEYVNYENTSIEYTDNSATEVQSIQTETPTSVQKTKIVEPPITESVKEKDYTTLIEKAKRRADNSFNNGNYDDAYNAYVEAANYADAKANAGNYRRGSSEWNASYNIKQSAATQFKTKAERLYDITGECDSIIKKLLQYAYDLNPTREIRNLQNQYKCN